MQGSRLLKESVAAVYETDTFNSLLKDVLHPGGLELTRRVAEIAKVDENSKVLDIACGKGEGCLLIAERYGCSVLGIDISDKKTTLAQSKARAKGLDGQVKFITADAENLPFADSIFDTVLSECSFSLLPNKGRAASEIKRVLKAGGRLVITDIVLKKRMLRRTQNELGFGAYPLIPCVAGAGPIEDYVKVFEQAGFRNLYIEDHSIELKKLGYQMGITFGGWEEFLYSLSAELSRGYLRECKDFASAVEAYRKLFAQRGIGFVLIRVTKP